MVALALSVSVEMHLALLSAQGAAGGGHRGGANRRDAYVLDRDVMRNESGLRTKSQQTCINVAQ